MALGGLRLDVCVLEFAYVQPTPRGGAPRGQGLCGKGEAFAGQGVGRVPGAAAGRVPRETGRLEPATTPGGSEAGRSRTQRRHWLTLGA